MKKVVTMTWIMLFTLSTGQAGILCADLVDRSKVSAALKLRTTKESRLPTSSRSSRKSVLGRTKNATTDDVSSKVRESDKAETNEVIRANAIVSGTAVRTYFDEIEKSILERNSVLRVLLNAIVAKEHVLLVGSPGNAKTTLTKLVFENIVDAKTGDPSFFAMQMTNETSLTDTHGGVNFDVLNRTGRQERFYDEGILGARFALLDEQFDMRPNGYRNILDVLAERAHSHGGKKHKGLTWTVVGASNTFIPEVFQKFDGSEQPRALIDRYAFVTLIPAELEKVVSRRAVIQDSRLVHRELPKVTIDDFEAIQKLVAQVEIPDHIADILSLVQYRLKWLFESKEQNSLQEYKEKVQTGERPIPPYKSTKYMSDRTLAKAARALAAQVAIDFAINQGKRNLVVNMKDLNILVDFYSLGGPESDSEIQHQITRASREIERDQLRTILMERKIVRDVIDEIVKEINAKLTQFAPQDIYKRIRTYSSASAPERRLLIDFLRALYLRGIEISRMDQKQIDQNASLIAEVSMADMAVRWLDELQIPNKKQMIATWKLDAPISKKRNKVHRHQRPGDPTSSFKEFEKVIRDKKDTRERIPKVMPGDFHNPRVTSSPELINEAKNVNWPTVAADQVEDLLDRGLDPNFVVEVPLGNKWTMIGLAAFYGRDAVVQLLLDRGADPELLSNHWDALKLAQYAGRVSTAEIIRKHLNKVTVQIAEVTSPYELIYEAEHLLWISVGAERVEDLLDRGLDPNIVIQYNGNDTKWTLIGIAAFYGKDSVVRLLLDRGADPTIPSFRGGDGTGLQIFDALQWAEYQSHESTAEIIRKHLDSSLLNDEVAGIHWRTVKIEKIEELLKRGLDPNYMVFYSESDTMTLLAFAVYVVRDDIVQLLLDRGANPKMMFLVDGKAMTALQLALEKNLFSTAELIENHLRK